MSPIAFVCSAMLVMVGVLLGIAVGLGGGRDPDTVELLMTLAVTLPFAAAVVLTTPADSVSPAGIAMGIGLAAIGLLVRKRGT